MRNIDPNRLVDSLPEDLVRRIETGVPVTLVVRKENGCLQVHEIDPQQAWFWTPEWQEREREADEDIAAGRIARYNSDEEFLAALEADVASPSE